jgi:NitT/TauT family transport system substrate-binding protein
MSLKALPEAKVVATSKDPYFKETVLLGDGMYMSGSFLAQKETAMLTMKAYFEAVKFWKENPAEANQIIADGLKFTVADVELVLGKDGSATDGGIYPFNWTEAAQFMGLTEGVPPFGKNGPDRRPLEADERLVDQVRHGQDLASDGGRGRGPSR